jgi:hypothetical protein
MRAAAAIWLALKVAFLSAAFFCLSVYMVLQMIFTFGLIFYFLFPY